MELEFLSTDAELQKKHESENNRVAVIVTVIWTILVIVILVLPFFYRLFPIPEAEGLMASFGNVEVAGGDQNTPNPENQVTNTNPVTTDTKVEKVETNDNPEDPTIKTEDVKVTPNPNPSPNPQPNPNPTPNPEPNPNPNALFPGGGGKGTDKGGGTQGNPGGIGDLGGTGRGDQGKGNGVIGNRTIEKKCDDAVTNNTGVDEDGVVWVSICVAEDGKVTSAESVSQTVRGDVTTITSIKLRDLAVKCAKNYRYKAAPGQGTACGTIPIYFGKQ